MLLLVSHSFLNLYLHEQPGCRVLEAQWRGFVSSQFLRQATIEALELARQHRITGWIADDRKLGAVRPVDLEWITTNIVPELVAVGVKRFAIIKAEDPLNQLLISNAAEDEALAALPFQIRQFTSVEQARTWACGLAV
jgi:hypothetical protein